MTPPRVAPLEPPYPPDVEASLRKWMPPGAAVEPLALFRTIARFPLLDERLRRLGAGFLGHGSLPVRLRELAILRTCARCGAAYEWGVHVSAFARSAGLDDAAIEATASGDARWTGLDGLVVRAVDELHDTGTVASATWTELAAQLSEATLVELVALVGFYHLISYLANSLGVVAEPWAAPFPARTLSASAHYEALLANVYAWMIGDRDDAERAAYAELEALDVIPGPGARVLDLGAGLGLHAVPLAGRGVDITALDSSAELLRALEQRSPRVRVVEGDLVRASEHVAGPFDLILCMGDTLTHLESEEAVDRALAGAVQLLAPGGRLVLRFRDYVTRPLRGAERFFLVRADAARIMTCCLDYESSRVTVTDIVHERAPDQDRWTMRASAYRKLRLQREAVVGLLEARGLVVSPAASAPRWIEIVARRPA